MATKNFTDVELTCKDGCGFLPAQDFMDKMQRVRDKLGFPLIVTSAARCPEYNAKVSGTGRTGPHTTGRAIDIAIRGERAILLIEAMRAEGFTGIGVSQKGGSRFIHGDDLPNSPTSPRPYIWSY